MRDVYKEYKLGTISWEEAYLTANNMAATVSSIPEIPYEETEYWARQMESLGIDASEIIMKQLGYKQTKNGLFHR